MGRYLVIENEPKLFALLKSSIEGIESTAEVIHFENLNLLSNKVAQLTDEEKATFFHFKILIFSLPDLNYKDWKKTIDDWKKHFDPKMPICLTTYENPSLTFHFLKQLEVYNVIFKPFDPLILKETISLALQKEKLAQAIEIKSQKSSTFIGVLKEVELQAISELGFLTLSDQSIPAMSLTKYFSPLFKVDRKQSVWAQCLLSMPHPQKPGFFINKFQFYGVKKDFLNTIRRYVQSLKAQETPSSVWGLNSIPQTTRTIKMALIAANNRENLLFQKDLSSHFKNLQVQFLDLAAASTWAEKLEHELVLNLTDLNQESLKKYFKEGTKYFWLPAVEPKETDLKELSQFYLDIFIQPYDRSFFYKKLKTLVSELVATEAHYLLSITCHEKIKAANTILVSEVNEVFVNFQYSRELEFNCFREFILLNKDEEQGIEIPAFCHFKAVEKNLPATEKNIYFHQFAFFGMTDHFLKEIRLWLLRNYVTKKD